MLKGLQKRLWRAKGKVKNILPGRQGTAKMINQGAPPEKREEERKNKEERKICLAQKVFPYTRNGKTCQTQTVGALPGGLVERVEREGAGTNNGWDD